MWAGERMAFASYEEARRFVMNSIGVTYPARLVTTEPPCGARDCPQCTPTVPADEGQVSRALDNSNTVLRRVLSEAQWQQWLNERRVTVTGSNGGSYLLDGNRLISNVRHLDGPRRWTGEFWRGCGHVSLGRARSYPTGEENVAAQVLMIMTDESEFFRTAVWS